MCKRFKKKYLKFKVKINIKHGSVAEWSKALV